MDKVHNADVPFGKIHVSTYDDDDVIIETTRLGDKGTLIIPVGYDDLGFGVSFSSFTKNGDSDVPENVVPFMQVVSTSKHGLDKVIEMFKVARNALVEKLGNEDPHVGYDGQIRGESRIVSAANRLPCGLVLIGARHCDSLMRAQAKAAGKKMTRSEQGFVNQHCEYLTRTEAWKVAIKTNQIIFRCGGDTADGGTLYSENLY